MQELQKYLWVNYPFIAVAVSVIIGMATVIIRQKLKEINGINKRLSRAIHKLESHIKDIKEKEIYEIKKSVDELEKIVYEIKGRMKDEKTN